MAYEVYEVDIYLKSGQKIHLDHMKKFNTEYNGDTLKKISWEFFPQHASENILFISLKDITFIKAKRHVYILGIRIY